MRDPARLQTAIEILDAVAEAARTGGAAADTIVRRAFAERRYAGARDRAAIRELVYEAVRFTADCPPSGRAAMLGLARARRPDLLALFDGSAHAPPPAVEGEAVAEAGLAPAWLGSQLSARFGDALDDELDALLARAPLDIRVNPARASPADVATALDAVPIAGLPMGLRVAQARALEQHPLHFAGAFEVQDAASQRAVLATRAAPGETVVDLCAGAGGKTLALACAMDNRGRLVAADTDRARLSAMSPRLRRHGHAAFVETRLLDPGHEVQALADLAGAADLVLVDAPCSGSGTWRRNPELRWRLTPDQLARLEGLQARLIGVGAGLVRPGGRLVYAVCSVLPSEGDAQVSPARIPPGFRLDHAETWSPATHGCDGFFIATLVRTC